VRIAGPEERGTVTDATGFYGFADLKPGDYLLVCEAKGFLPTTNRIVIKPGKPLNTDVPLKRQECGGFRTCKNRFTHTRC